MRQIPVLGPDRLRGHCHRGGGVAEEWGWCLAWSDRQPCQNVGKQGYFSLLEAENNGKCALCRLPNRHPHHLFSSLPGFDDEFGLEELREAEVRQAALAQAKEFAGAAQFKIDLR